MDINLIIKFLTKVFNSNVFNLLLGSMLTFCFSYFLNRQKRNQTLEDKIIEKRIAAYEEIYNVISALLVFLYSKDNITPKECTFRRIDSNLTNSNIKKILGVPQPFITIESLR